VERVKGLPVGPLTPNSLPHSQFGLEAEVAFHPSPMRLKTENRFALHNTASY
jgi:hypothetical protein